MTADRQDPTRDLVEQVMRPWIRRHPRSSDASLERLRDVLGVVKVNGPVPSWREFIDADEGASTERSGDDVGR